MLVGWRYLFGLSTWRPRAYHAASRYIAAAFSCLWSRLSTHGKSRRVTRMGTTFDVVPTGARLICIGCCFGALLGCVRRSSLPIAFSPSGDSPRPFCAARPRTCALTLDPKTLSFVGGGSPPLTCRTTHAFCAPRCARRTPRQPPCVIFPSVEYRGCKLRSRVGASDFGAIVEICTAAVAI